MGSSQLIVIGFKKDTRDLYDSFPLLQLQAQLTREAASARVGRGRGQAAGGGGAVGMRADST